jgi:hypothetical protein
LLQRNIAALVQRRRFRIKHQKESASEAQHSSAVNTNNRPQMPLRLRRADQRRFLFVTAEHRGARAAPLLSDKAPKRICERSSAFISGLLQNRPSQPHAISKRI